jgi:hypothetical protein
MDLVYTDIEAHSVAQNYLELPHMFGGDESGRLHFRVNTGCEWGKLGKHDSVYREML